MNTELIPYTPIGVAQKPTASRVSEDRAQLGSLYLKEFMLVGMYICGKCCLWGAQQHNCLGQQRGRFF